MTDTNIASSSGQSGLLEPINDRARRSARTVERPAETPRKASQTGNTGNPRPASRPMRTR